MADKTLNCIKNPKDFGYIEYICIYYALNYLGLSFYQISKLATKNLKRNCDYKALYFIDIKKGYR